MKGRKNAMEKRQNATIQPDFEIRANDRGREAGSTERLPTAGPGSGTGSGSGKSYRSRCRFGYTADGGYLRKIGRSRMEKIVSKIVCYPEEAYTAECMMTPAEVSTLVTEEPSLYVTPECIADWCFRRRIPSVKRGRSYFVHRANAEALRAGLLEMVARSSEPRREGVAPSDGSADSAEVLATLRRIEAKQEALLEYTAMGFERITQVLGKVAAVGAGKLFD